MNSSPPVSTIQLQIPTWREQCRRKLNSSFQGLLNRGIQYATIAPAQLTAQLCEYFDDIVHDTLGILKEQSAIDPPSVNLRSIDEAQELLSRFFAEEKEHLSSFVSRIDPPISQLAQSDYAKLFIMEKRIADLFARFRRSPQTPVVEKPGASRSVASEEAAAMPIQMTPKVDRRRVFLVHGRNKQARDQMVIFLRSLDLDPWDFDRAVKSIPHGSPHIGDVLRWAFQNTWCVLILITGDDEARLSQGLWTPGEKAHEKVTMPQPRLNVVFEAGRAIALNEEKTVLVQIGPSKPFSDIQGRYLHHFDGSIEQRNKLKGVLTSAGCAVKESEDWLYAGNFDDALLFGTPAARPEQSSATTPSDSPFTNEGLPLPREISTISPESSFTLDEPAKLLLQAAADTGQIAVFNQDNAAGPIIKAGGQVFSNGTDPYISEIYFGVIQFLVRNDLARQAGEHVYRLTAKGFKMARGLKA